MIQYLVVGILRGIPAIACLFFFAKTGNVALLVAGVAAALGCVLTFSFWRSEQLDAEEEKRVE